MGRGFFTYHLERVAEDLKTVIDFGTGEGTYSILGRHIAPSARWIGIEIFAPYLKRYDLDQKYDCVILSDLRHPEIKHDLSIFGDVLEHLPELDVQRVLEIQAELSRYIYVSVPIIPAPQGSSHGNDHERHLHDWSFHEMTELLLSLSPAKWDAWQGHTVGRWWLDL
jgi:hypothetical protein